MTFIASGLLEKMVAHPDVIKLMQSKSDIIALRVLMLPSFLQHLGTIPNSNKAKLSSLRTPIGKTLTCYASVIILKVV